jgi:hypothetical protein
MQRLGRAAWRLRKRYVSADASDRGMQILASEAARQEQHSRQRQPQRASRGSDDERIVEIIPPGVVHGVQHPEEIKQSPGRIAGRNQTPIVGCEVERGSLRIVEACLPHRPFLARLDSRHGLVSEPFELDLQVRLQERGAPARQGGDVHAETPLRRQRKRNALPPEPVERRREPLLRPWRLRTHFRPVSMVYRGTVAARARAHGLLRADNELLQAPRSGLRGAGQSRHVPAQPLGGCANSGVFGFSGLRNASSFVVRTLPPTRIWRSRPC